jgi:hypothetical protein
MYDNAETLFIGLRESLKTKEVTFAGFFYIAEDPLISARQHVVMLQQQVWYVSGFRFK